MTDKIKFNLNYGKPVSSEEAEQMGFIIEGPVAFLFDLSNAVAILGYNTLDKTWQFDASVNENGETWQFVEHNLNEALQKAETVCRFISLVYNSLGVNQDEFDHIEVLEAWCTCK